jgi:glycosyltransferase involved in cell wall biosynthesis
MKVSVIIPTYNRPTFLIEAVRSILVQRHKDTEIVVVDDGSTDDTIAQFKHFLGLLDHESAGKILFVSQPNCGAQVARNRGYATSTGDCVVFMDSDDLMLPDGLAEGVRALEQSDADYVHLLVQLCDEFGRPTESAIIGRTFGDAPEEIMDLNWQTMGAIYKRRLVDKVGPWNPELTGSQDWEYQARVKMSGAKRRFVPVIVGYWRTHTQGRIGTSNYNYRYVLSVEKACIAIGNEAEARGLLNRQLRKRLLRRLLIHAIEAGSTGAWEDRSRLLRAAASFGHRYQRPILWFVDLVRIRRLDSMLYRSATS